MKTVKLESVVEKELHDSKKWLEKMGGRLDNFSYGETCGKIEAYKKILSLMRAVK